MRWEPLKSFEQRSSQASQLLNWQGRGCRANGVEVGTLVRRLQQECNQKMVVAWTRAVGHNKRPSDSGCVLKVRFTGFPDESDVGFERKEKTMGNYKDFGLNIWPCLWLALTCPLAFRDGYVCLKDQRRVRQ